MAKASPVTWNFIRYRLTDPVSGADNWQAEAFGLLVAERYYPDLVTACRETRSDAYGFFRHRLNHVWSRLQDASTPAPVSDRDLQAITEQIPDIGLKALSAHELSPPERSACTSHVSFSPATATTLHGLHLPHTRACSSISDTLTRQANPAGPHQSRSMKSPATMRP